MRRTTRFAAVAVIALIAAAAGFWTARHLDPSQGTARSVPVATIPPDDVALPDLTGYSRRLSEWRGKVVLVNFWASWCGPCREEIPLLKRMQATWGKRGLQVIGIAVDDEENVSAYHRAVKFNYPVLIGDLEGLALMARYGNETGGLPYSVVLDANGRPISHKLGAYEAAELTAVISRSLIPQPKPR